MNDELRRIIGLGQQRKTANLLLQPSLQLRLPMYFLLITMVFAGLMAFVISSAYRSFYVAIAAEQPAYLANILSAQTDDFMVVSGVVTAGYLLTVLVIAIIHSHRMVGPTIALRRQVEALKNGNYSARVTLRRNDAFGELADDLNELAALLEQGDKPG